MSQSRGTVFDRLPQFAVDVIQGATQRALVDDAYEALSRQLCMGNEAAIAAARELFVVSDPVPVLANGKLVEPIRVAMLRDDRHKDYTSARLALESYCKALDIAEHA